VNFQVALSTGTKSNKKKKSKAKKAAGEAASAILGLTINDHDDGVVSSGTGDADSRENVQPHVSAKQNETSVRQA
jgi:hypothetical protein